MKKKINIQTGLSELMKSRRIELGLTQVEVSKKLGYESPQFLSNFECRKCGLPLNKLKILIRIYKLDAQLIVEILLKEQKKLLKSHLT